MLSSAEEVSELCALRHDFNWSWNVIHIVFPLYQIMLSHIFCLTPAQSKRNRTENGQ